MTRSRRLSSERQARVDFDRLLAERRIDDALAAAELLLRDPEPRQLDVFKRYARLCHETGRLQQNIEILRRAADAIGRRSPSDGQLAWAALAALAPDDGHSNAPRAHAESEREGAKPRPEDERPLAAEPTDPLDPATLEELRVLERLSWVLEAFAIGANSDGRGALIWLLESLRADAFLAAECRIELLERLTAVQADANQKEYEYCVRRLSSTCRWLWNRVWPQNRRLFWYADER